VPSKDILKEGIRGKGGKGAYNAFQKSSFSQREGGGRVRGGGKKIILSHGGRKRRHPQNLWLRGRGNGWQIQSKAALILFTTALKTN